MSYWPGAAPRTRRNARAKMRYPLMAIFIWNAIISSAVAEKLVVAPQTILDMATRHDFRGRNEFRIEQTGEGSFLRSTPRRSASGLYLKTDVHLDLSWSQSWHWRIDTLQRTADIRSTEHDDFGAMLAFVFGEPSWWDRDVPTIAYVWTGTDIANGTVLKSPRSRNLVYIQLRGRSDVGRLQTEMRNVAEDFVALFGRRPPRLHYVAFFNDNDQTNEPVSALLGPIFNHGSMESWVKGAP